MQEKIALPSQNGINANKKALYEHNAEFSNVVSGGKYVYHWALKDKSLHMFL